MDQAKGDKLMTLENAKASPTDIGGQKQCLGITIGG